MEKKTKTAQTPKYRILGTFTNVLVTVPGANDPFMKFIQAHTFDTEKGLVEVPEHYRRGDKFNGRWLTRHFYLDPEDRAEYAQEMIAKVVVIEKNNEDGKFLIINITPYGKGTGQLRLSFGCPTGNFEIPGTGKWVAFKKI